MGTKPTGLTDRPELNNSFAALIYQVVGYYSIPFLLLLLLQGGTDGWVEVAAALEIAYHVFNLLVALFIFREYLKDTIGDVRYDLSRLMNTVSVSTGLIMLIAIAFHAVFRSDQGISKLMAYGMLPLSEVDLFILPCDVVATYPLFGTLCMGFVTPITISCLLYGSVFAPICYKRPVLAYVAMAVYLAFPRFCNAATFWDPATEWTLYFTQLPLHMIACWSYQKADSIWAPVLTHMIVNLFSALLILLTWVLPAL